MNRRALNVFWQSVVSVRSLWQRAPVSDNKGSTLGTRSARQVSVIAPRDLTLGIADVDLTPARIVGYWFSASP